MQLKKIIFSLPLIALAVVFILTPPAHAVNSYVTENWNFEIGENQISSGTQLGNQNPIAVASYIINVILGLLGVIFLVLIIWGGFTWMKARGNEEEVTRAKNIIISATIGLVIILASYGIMMFLYMTILNISGAATGL